MRILYTKKFASLFRELPEQIKRKAEKQERLFAANMFYPSLHTEKLTPKSDNLWSFRVDSAYRIIFHFTSDKITFLYVGHHKDIYRF